MSSLLALIVSFVIVQPLPAAGAPAKEIGKGTEFTLYKKIDFSNQQYFRFSGGKILSSAEALDLERDYCTVFFLKGDEIVEPCTLTLTTFNSDGYSSHLQGANTALMLTCYIWRRSEEPTPQRLTTDVIEVAMRETLGISKLVHPKSPPAE
ncbi:MAG: hypothetical protein C5B49_00215 [Bdellovibrio sp.]|nr:MAG: hypothetical protein C5B49_00215 [Bdellovibrio sp.]